MMIRVIQRIVLDSRWLQLPLYLGLIVVLAIMVVKFGQDLIRFSVEAWGLEETSVIHTVLTLVDLMLVANLIVMVVIAGCDSFLMKIRDTALRDKCAWLGKIESGSIEVKVAVSIVLISGIHLLGAFVNYERVTNEKLMLLLAMHLGFVVTAVFIALVGRLLGRDAD